MFYEYHRSIGAYYLMVSERECRNFNFPLHLHNSFELIYIKEGRMAVHIGGVEYTVGAGEAALIFPGQLHAYRSLEEPCSRMCIFSADYLPDLEPGHHPVFPAEPALLDRLYACRENRFAVRSVLYDFAAQYVQGAICPEAEAEGNDLVCRVVQYIEEHYAESITLRQMAEQMGYNYRYLSGVVNRCFKTTFPRVVNQFRIDLACRLLRKGDGNITEIAGRCGFDSQRNFNRCFKELTGKTPREYKRGNSS